MYRAGTGPGGVGCLLRIDLFRNGAAPMPRTNCAPPRSYAREDDAVWPPVTRAYGGPVAVRWPLAQRAGMATLRLSLPVALTMVLLGAVYLYADALLPMSGQPALVRGAGLAVS